jgi:hypothetical protein
LISIRNRLAAASLAAVSAGAVVAGMTLSAPAGAASGHVVRPSAHLHGVRADTPVQVTAQSQEFANGSTAGFCNGASQGNPACDGAEGDYGTIDAVKSGFSNGGAGNYAPATHALTGSYFGLMDGTQLANQGIGCPNSGVEYCTGPYFLFGSGQTVGQESVYPAHGFTVTDDLYLSPDTAAPVGSLIDDDVEINNNAGTYGIDNVITACDQSGGFTINFGHNSPGSCAGTPVINTDGWYRFVWVFSNTSGYAYLTEYVYSDGSTSAIATSGPQPVGGGSAELVGNWGGPGYLWLPTEQFDGIGIANVAVQLAQHPVGHAP